MRDPQEIVASFDRDDVDEPRLGEAKTNFYLWLTYALSAGVFLRQPATRRMLVRHEDLLAEPERVLREILDRARLHGAEPDLDALADGEPAAAGTGCSQADTVARAGRRGVRTPARVDERSCSCARRFTPGGRRDERSRLGGDLVGRL